MLAIAAKRERVHPSTHRTTLGHGSSPKLAGKLPGTARRRPSSATRRHTATRPASEDEAVAHSSSPATAPAANERGQHHDHLGALAPTWILPEGRPGLPEGAAVLTEHTQP